MGHIYSNSIISQAESLGLGESCSRSQKESETVAHNG